MFLSVRANRILATKPGVREGSAAQDRTCISISHIHTYLSIYIYFHIDRYTDIPFLLSLQGDSDFTESPTQASGNCGRTASSHSSKDGGENLAKSHNLFLPTLAGNAHCTQFLWFQDSQPLEQNEQQVLQPWLLTWHSRLCQPPAAAPNPRFVLFV